MHPRTGVPSRHCKFQDMSRSKIASSAVRLSLRHRCVFPFLVNIQEGLSCQSSFLLGTVLSRSPHHIGCIVLCDFSFIIVIIIFYLKSCRSRSGRRSKKSWLCVSSFGSLVSVVHRAVSHIFQVTWCPRARLKESIAKCNACHYHVRHYFSAL